MRSNKTFNMVLTGLFMAIIIIMTTVPNLGYINLVVIKVTMVHVPVIIGSVLLGPKYGAVLGGTFGLTSLIVNTFNPSLLSFAFSPFYQVGNIGGNGWSVVIALFLGYSLITMNWHISWVIWPVAGVLYAAVCGIAAMIRK